MLAIEKCIDVRPTPMGTWQAWLPDGGLRPVRGWEDVAELRRLHAATDRWATADIEAFRAEHGEPDVELLDAIRRDGA